MQETAEKYWETRGIKDLNSYAPSEFRAAYPDEIEGKVPANYEMGWFIHAGGANIIKQLTAYASMTDAKLVDVEDGYSGTPIYVRTSPSKAGSVTNNGGVVTNNADGSTTYSFPGGTYSPSGLAVIDKTQWEDNGNSQGATSVITRLTGFGTKVRRPANPTKASIPSGYRLQKYVAIRDEWVTQSGIPWNWYDCTTWTDYYTAPSYDYVGYFASSGSGGGGGSVTVYPYTPEIVRGQRLQQGVLTQATTQDLPCDYRTYAPSSATEATKTVLAQSGSTAMQNFAFDGMEDID